MRLTDLAQVLRAAGLTVIELPGWQNRGVDLQRVDGVTAPVEWAQKTRVSRALRQQPRLVDNT